MKENKGVAGVDGITISRFERHLDRNLTALGSDILKKTYRPLPLLKILVDKGDNEARGLCIPTVRDRVAQSAMLGVIEPLLEKEFEECSFAYRKGRSIRQAVFRIQEYYDQGYQWVVDADIDAFFDCVDHGLLMGKIRKYIHDEDVVGLISQWVSAEVWDGTDISVMEKGIPQGSPVSPVLANLFLDELDESLMKKGFRLIRYADDFIILCKSEKKAAEALHLAKEVLERLHLQLDEEDVVSFDRGFTYLGLMFVRSMVMKPYYAVKKKKKVLYYPPTMDMRKYIASKRGRNTFVQPTVEFPPHPALSPLAGGEENKTMSLSTEAGREGKGLNSHDFD